VFCLIFTLTIKIAKQKDRQTFFGENSQTYKISVKLNNCLLCQMANVAEGVADLILAGIDHGGGANSFIHATSCPQAN
jgi:hypothetical protein